MKCAKLFSAAIIAVIVAVTALPAYASAVGDESTARRTQGDGQLPTTITVVGIGQSSGTPDVATVSLGVEAADADAATAFAKASEAATKILAAVTEKGIPREDVQTTGINIYSQIQPTTGESGPAALPARLYQAQIFVNIKVRNLDQTAPTGNITKVGELIDSAVKAGANLLNGISFDLSDPSALASKARANAIADARARAQELAAAFGVKVGKLLQIEEISGGPGVLPYANMGKGGLGGGGGVANAAPISQGQLSVMVSVKAVFTLE
jgi:hypothetical protein